MEYLIKHGAQMETQEKVSFVVDERVTMAFLYSIFYIFI